MLPFLNIVMKAIFILIGAVTLYRGVVNMWEARETVMVVQDHLAPKNYGQDIYNKVYLQELLSGVCEIVCGLGFIILLWLHVKVG